MREQLENLSPGENIRLIMLAEECAAMVGIIHHILLHGFDANSEYDETTNRERLASKCGDTLCLVALLCMLNDIDEQIVETASSKRTEMVEQYFNLANLDPNNGSEL